jgi:hypothetical protein
MKKYSKRGLAYISAKSVRSQPLVLVARSEVYCRLEGSDSGLVVYWVHKCLLSDRAQSSPTKSGHVRSRPIVSDNV